MTTIEKRCGNGNRRGTENVPKNDFIKKLTYYYLLYTENAHSYFQILNQIRKFEREFFPKRTLSGVGVFYVKLKDTLEL